jgi:HPt (histidine-containing phosphotransfer) domain-containing protein
MSRAYRVIDPSELYAATGNDLALFRILSQMFLESAPAMLTAMQAAAQLPPVQSAAAFIAASHTLRGIAALVGAHALASALAALEQQAKAGGCPAGAALAPVAGELTLVCAEVAHSMRAYRSDAP